MHRLCLTPCPPIPPVSGDRSEDSYSFYWKGSRRQSSQSHGQRLALRDQWCQEGDSESDGELLSSDVGWAWLLGLPSVDSVLVRSLGFTAEHDAQSCPISLLPSMLNPKSALHGFISEKRERKGACQVRPLLESRTEQGPVSFRLSSDANTPRGQQGNPKQPFSWLKLPATSPLKHKTLPAL